ncbi:hypothetical protein [Klebsiella michiganensis]|uniref:hypothetical protein n=1 Tax=Klebsiella michiganensis TaxID=1134687 RepID=UPI00356B6DE6
MKSKLTITDHRLAEIHAECEERYPAIVEIRAMIEELQERRNAAMDSEPVAWIVHARTGDQLTTDGSYVANAEGILGLHSTPLYRNAQQPVVPDEKPVPNPLKMYAVDAVAAIAEVRGWNACRAAMLQELQKSAGDAGDAGGVQISRGCRSNENMQDMQDMQAGNSPVIPDGLIGAVNRLLDSDGSRGCYSAIRCGDALDEIERLLAAAPQEVK